MGKTRKEERERGGRGEGEGEGEGEDVQSVQVCQSLTQGPEIP